MVGGLERKGESEEEEEEWKMMRGREKRLETLSGRCVEGKCRVLYKRTANISRVNDSVGE